MKLSNTDTVYRFINIHHVASPVGTLWWHNQCSLVLILLIRHTIIITHVITIIIMMMDFLNAVGGRLAAASGDPRETSFLWQRVSVLIQRFNAILISETFFHSDEAPDL